MPTGILEAQSAAERARQRQRLGQLRDLTVQPATKTRYTKAVDGSLSFVNSNPLALPKKRGQMDALVCEYVAHLWSSGAGRALASDTV